MSLPGTKSAIMRWLNYGLHSGLAWIIIPHEDLGYFSDSFTYDSWRIFVAVCTIPSLTSAMMFFFMPESPKFFLTVSIKKKLKNQTTEK